VAEEVLLSRLGQAHGCGLESGAEIETRAADGGREAEEQRSDKGEADGEDEHPSVDLNYGAQFAKWKPQQLRDSRWL
jgi:hypothetical protein